MRDRLHRSRLLGAALWVTLGAVGCGSSEPSARPDIAQTPDEELHATSQKRLLFEFRAKVRKHGVAGAKQELPNVIESFEGYENQAVGEHLDTYRQIFEKLKALEATLAGSPSKEQLVEDAEELAALAAGLPGKADENPVVD